MAGVMVRPVVTFQRAPLADACVTEWRTVTGLGSLTYRAVPLADACVTEWRGMGDHLVHEFGEVPLADACVTEWRAAAKSTRPARTSATR